MSTGCIMPGCRKWGSCQNPENCWKSKDYKHPLDRDERMPIDRALPRDTLRLYRILTRHRGKANAVSMADLYQEWSGLIVPRDSSGRPEIDVATASRRMRYLVDDLREIYGIAVMSSARSGYWIAGNESELDEVYREFRARGLKSLSTAARLKKITLAEEVRQIEMDLRREAR